MRTPTAALIRRRGALGALSAALLLTATACGPEDDTGAGATGTSSPPASAPTAASPSPAPSSTAGGGPTASASKGSAASPTASADGPVCKGWSGIDLTLLPGAHITKGRAYLEVQEGTWTCPRPDAPVWHAIGPRHEIRLSETAEVLVNEPFYSTDVNKRIDVRTFVDKADTAATATRMYFAYRIDGSGTITKLDQRWKA
ncbi:hypothetical protein ACH4S8_32170 [Streptomyces sp. NPDC021080]|uniref:hypothetical protein n=1 Tax=Streptomyces sp. NPDC021080 TaxID=3365110 RepID=UPI0037953E59